MAITPPLYVTGRRLWLLAMPSTLRPRAEGVKGGDPGFQPGIVSTITKVGAGVGVLSIFAGGPTDTFAARVEIMGTGGAGVGTFRTRLQTAEAWSLTQIIPAADPDTGLSIYELPESGIFLSFSSTFTITNTYDFSTTESAQQKALREAVALDIDRVLRTRGALPLAEWGGDIEHFAAACAALDLLELRGFNPKSTHEQTILRRARRAKQQLRQIREEIEQGAWGGQGTTAGVAASGQKAQGVDLW